MKIILDNDNLYFGGRLLFVARTGSATAWGVFRICCHSGDYSYMSDIVLASRVELAMTAVDLIRFCSLEDDILLDNDQNRTILPMDNDL